MTIEVPQDLLFGVVIAIGVFIYFWIGYLLILPFISIVKIASPLRRYTSTLSKSNIAVLIPANNMEIEISGCIESLKHCDIGESLLAIFVIDDHSSDATSSIARQCGAKVLERHDGLPGKTFALDWAIRTSFSGSSYDVFVIVDATARAAPQFLSFLCERVQAGEDVVISAAEIDQKRVRWFARGTGLALVHRNLQNYFRERLSLSCLVSGRGMAFSKRFIERFGWTLAVPESIGSVNHPTEDWRHGLNIAMAGCRVAFESRARILTPLRDTLHGAVRQSVRWERGRFLNSVGSGLSALRKAVVEFSLRKVCAALDAVQPPFALLILFAFLFGLSCELTLNDELTTLAWTPTALLLVYTGAVVLTGICNGLSPFIILSLPIYLVIRLTTSLLAFFELIRHLKNGLQR